MFTVSLAEICFNETVNTESNDQTFAFEITQSNIMANSNKENTSLNTWTMKNVRPHVLNKEDRKWYQED